MSRNAEPAARVRIRWLDVLEAPRPAQAFVHHTFHSVAVFEAAVRHLAERGGQAVVAVTWDDGHVAGFALPLERAMASSPEPFLAHVRARLADCAMGDVADLRDEARRLLNGYQVSL